MANQPTQTPGRPPGQQQDQGKPGPKPTDEPKQGPQEGRDAPPKAGELPQQGPAGDYTHGHPGLPPKEKQ